MRTRVHHRDPCLTITPPQQLQQITADPSQHPLAVWRREAMGATGSWAGSQPSACPREKAGSGALATGAAGWCTCAAALVSYCGYLTLFLCALLMSAEGFAQPTEDCHIERCMNEYRKHQPHVGPLSANQQYETLAASQSNCAALRTYGHCINKTVGCHGNIWYYTLRNYVRQQMEVNNCTANNNYNNNNNNNNGHLLKPEQLPQRGSEPEEANNATSRNSKPREYVVPAVCLYQGQGTFRHCGLFGDPHLRTFYEAFQTCRIKGTWPLVNNNFLTVQVTNDPVHNNTEATATSKLTVIVRGNPECTSVDFQTYQAQTNSLPGSFDDGRVSVGPYDSLELVEVEPGRHVEIHIRYINTVIIIKQIGRYFTFSIQMPEELVSQSSLNQDLQLCVRGCPLVEQINYQDYLAARRFMTSVQDTPSLQVGLEPKPTISRSQAEAICKNAKLVSFYFDSCVFDLVATGDVNFTLSAMSSLMDVIKLNPAEARLVDNRTSFETYDKKYGDSGGGAAGSWVQLMGLCLVSVVLCVRLGSVR